MIDWLIPNKPTALEFEILRTGRVYVHDLSNALSAYGLALQGAIKRGFMQCGPREGEGTHYKITAKGRQVLEAERLRGLAEIGVYEVHI